MSNADSIETTNKDLEVEARGVNSFDEKIERFLRKNGINTPQKYHLIKEVKDLYEFVKRHAPHLKNRPAMPFRIGKRFDDEIESN